MKHAAIVTQSCSFQTNYSSAFSTRPQFGEGNLRANRLCQRAGIPRSAAGRGLSSRKLGGFADIGVYADAAPTAIPPHRNLAISAEPAGAGPVRGDAFP
jgi:hypothetical protein